MQSLLAEVDRAAVDRFLSAVDLVMNSNTVLLKVTAEQSLTVDNRQEVLRAYLRSDLFEQMMFEADCQRQWYLLSNPYAPPEEDHVPVRLLRDGFRAALAPLRYEEFAGRLRWLLREAYSPYNCHKSAQEADVLVADFVHEVLAPLGGGRLAFRSTGMGVRLRGARFPALHGVLHPRSPAAPCVLRRVHQRHRHPLPPGSGVLPAADQRLTLRAAPRYRPDTAMTRTSSSSSSRITGCARKHR